MVPHKRRQIDRPNCGQSSLLSLIKYATRNSTLLNFKMSQQLVHNRQETLRALACLGVVLPPHTKLSDDALDKRRRQALVATQPLSQVLSSSDTKSSPLLNFSSFSAWPSNGTPVHEVSSRLSLQETGLSAKGLNPGLAPLRLDPFNDLRQTVIRIAKAWDDGYRYCVVQDMQQSEAERVPIHIRVSTNASFASASSHPVNRYLKCAR